MDSSGIDGILAYFNKKVRKSSNLYKSNLTKVLKYIQHCIECKEFELQKIEKCINILVENSENINNHIIEKILIAICERCTIDYNHEFVKLLRERVKVVEDGKIIIMFKMLMIKKFQIYDENETIIERNELYEKYRKVLQKHKMEKLKYTSINMTENSDNQDNVKNSKDFLLLDRQDTQGQCDLCNVIHKDKQYDGKYFISNVDCFNLCNIVDLNILESMYSWNKKCHTDTERILKQALHYYAQGKYLMTKRTIQKVLTMDLKRFERLIAYYFISFTHLFMAEYLECNFYIDKAISMVANTSHTTNMFFLHFKLLCERLASVQGPTPHSHFVDYFNAKNKKTLDLTVRDTKFFTNIQLSDNLDLLREARTCSFTKDFVLLDLIDEVTRYFHDYKFLSFYTVDEKLVINVIYYGENLVIDNFITKININELETKYNSIMSQSKETLLRTVRSKKETNKWWTDRIKLDKELKDLLESANLEIKEKIKNAHDKIFLLVDEKTSFFCWESMPIFNDKHIYRIPSFEYFRYVDYKNCTVKLDNITYLLDPENNLHQTKTKIHKFLDRNKLITGITNKMPDKKETQIISNSSLFIYFGHGTGEKYLPKNHYKILRNKAAFIFGCSSSRLFCRENFKQNGIALKYLETVNNFIGCLWDVTDKDLDTFSISFLELLLEGDKYAADIISSSKLKMKLKYLNGASLVLWGLPVKYIT